ncbi:general transcription factor IIH subunit 1-like [Diadema antillarum]|uniref:general transcription factor IIH subunit 1-like n=1 Tax=Diadema antillarum TaxID=105358 RepID=UPI003A847902
MATSSEEVLLVVNQVRCRKSNGSLYLMGKRLAWQEDNKDVFTVSHYYADVRQQRISQDTSSKVQLQVLLHNGSSSKFHFANREGAAAQRRDRTDVKELLQQLLPKFRSQASRELEQKNKMLKDDPELFQLYRDLVMSGVMTADEFWASRINMAQHESDMSSLAAGSSSGGHGVGVSAAFLSDIKPQTDGCNGVKYNLTADIIDSIFRIYPAVKKKHLDSVPHTMSEKEFWTQFFQSQYFHRDRINAGSKDLFAECARRDEKEMTEEAIQTVKDPLLDIQGLSDNTLDDGFGYTMDSMKTSTNAVNKSIIKRFNHHNTRVLAASESNKRPFRDTTDGPSSSQTSSQSSSSSVAAAGSNSNANHHHHADSGGGDDESSAKKARLQEAIAIEDLASGAGAKDVSLRLERTDRYYHGPTIMQSRDYFSSEEVVGAMRALQEEMSSSVPRLNKVISSNTARAVMSELTPGGALMGSASHQPVHTLYSAEIQKELKRVYAALSELLRHFWSCFPVTSKSLEEKLFRMKGTLEQFQAKKMKPFRETLAKQHIGLNLLNHMEDLLQTAYRKYAAWQNKRMGVGKT